MDIKLDFPEEAGVVEIIKDGDDNITGIRLRPKFATARGSACLANVSVKSGLGKVLETSRLLVSGVTGQLRKTGKTEAPTVIPVCDRPDTTTSQGGAK